MTAAISAPEWDVLEAALSWDRLAAYGHVSDAGFDAGVARYLWNAALCESLYPVLHFVEVVLRNRIDEVLCRRFGEAWPKDARLLGPNELRRIASARDKLARRGKPTPSHADMVAELSFGFWVALFSRYYERPNRLWPWLSRDAMRGAPRAKRTRAEFHRRLDEIRALRNRAYHYEPLWHWPDLDDQYQRAREMLSWLSPEVAELAILLDRFEEVRMRGFDAYQCVLEGGFVCPVHNVGCRHVAGLLCRSAPRREDRA